MSLYFLQRFDESEKAYDRALAVEPSDFGFYWRKIELYQSWYGDWEKIDERKDLR